MLGHLQEHGWLGSVPLYVPVTTNWIVRYSDRTKGQSGTCVGFWGFGVVQQSLNGFIKYSHLKGPTRPVYRINTSFNFIRDRWFGSGEFLISCQYGGHDWCHRRTLAFRQSGIPIVCLIDESLSCWIYNINYRHALEFPVNSQHRYGTGSWNNSFRIIRACVPYICNIRAADNLLT